MLEIELDELCKALMDFWTLVATPGCSPHIAHINETVCTELRDLLYKCTQVVNSYFFHCSCNHRGI